MSKVVHFTLFLMGLIIGTGAYVAFSPMMYSLAMVAASIYVVSASTKKISISRTSALVFLLYAIFLLLNFLRDMDSTVPIARLYVNFFAGLCIYLIVISIFYLKPDPDAFRFLPLACILAIAFGILLQVEGVVDFTKQEIGTGTGAALLRPGGFLNPNMSAALCLIWLFVAMESKSNNSFWVKSACLTGSASIVAITQSRSAILFLCAYFICKVYEGRFRNSKYYLIALLCLFGLYEYSGLSELISDLYKANLVRAQGDASSQERYLLLKTAFDAFIEHPMTGLGMRAMHRFFQADTPDLIPGTHNEILEWLVNFGMFGFCVMLFVYFRFYHISSLKYLCLCILPSFLFSHNFFETTALQVALAFAFCLGAQGNKRRTSSRICKSLVADRVAGRSARPLTAARNQEFTPLSQPDRT